MQPVERVHAVVIDLHDDVAGREADILSETAGLHLRDKYAALTLYSEMLRPFRTQSFGMQANLRGGVLIGGRFLFLCTSSKYAIARFDHHIGPNCFAVPPVIHSYYAYNLQP